jgi:hypothetical protein
MASKSFELEREKEHRSAKYFKMRKFMLNNPTRYFRTIKLAGYGAHIEEYNVNETEGNK